MLKRLASIAVALGCLFAAPAQAQTVLQLQPGLYDSDAQAYFNTLATSGCATPTTAFKIAVSNYIVAEKNAGNWGGQDFAYITAAPDPCTASINLAQPGLYTITWNGACTISVANGLVGDGSTCYGDTNVNVSALTRVKRDSSHIDICVGGLSSNMTGGVGANSDILISASTNGSKSTEVTSNVSISDVGGGGIGCHYGVRTSSTLASTGKNGVVQSNGVASTSVALPATHFGICRSVASFCTSGAKILFAEVGQPLASDLIHYNDVSTMLAAIQAGSNPNTDACNGSPPDPCLPAYFTGSGVATNQATVVAGSIAISTHTPIPTTNTVDQTTFKYFPFSISENINPRSVVGTYSNGGGVGYFSWAYRTNGVDATRAVAPNSISPARYYASGGNQYRCYAPMSSIAKGDAATAARIAWSVGYPAHDVSGYGYLDLTEAAGIADDHVLFFDSVDGTPNLTDQVQTLCTDITTYPGIAALPMDYVILPYGKIAALSITPRDVMVDWEVQDGHTCAQTTAEMTLLAAITHSKGYPFVVYTNPQDAGTSPYNGWCRNGTAGANLDAVQSQVDYFGLMLLADNKVGTVPDELAYSVAGFSSINYAKTMLIPLISRISVSDAIYVRSYAVSNSVGRIDMFLNGAIAGGQCSRPTNEKIAALTGLVGC